MRKLILLGLLLSPGRLPAGVEILLANLDSKGDALSCSYFFSETVNTLSQTHSVVFENFSKKIWITRDQIYDVYRSLGTVPESEIEELRQEDAKFPARSVIYLRSVSDKDGSVEGIMRVVTEEVGLATYYNHHFTPFNQGSTAQIPIAAKYTDPVFREFLNKRFPKRTEFGRLVFAKGVNEFRVLMDLSVAAVGLAYFPHSSGRDHHLVVESVRPAVHRYQAMGLQIVEDPPIHFNDDRVLMATPMEDSYNRFLGNIDRAMREFEQVPYFDKAARRAAIKGLDEAIGKVSDSEALQALYLYGHFQRANAFYDVDDFASMRKDVALLVRRSPEDQDARLLELFAEAGSRFNWVTGVGDVKSALDYLDDPVNVKRFADSQFRMGQVRDARLFVKGLVYLGSGQVEKAREVREAVDRENKLKEEAAEKQRLRFRMVSSEHYGVMRVLELRERYYDPKTKVGNPELALEKADACGTESPVGITSALYAYKAEVLTALGRAAEAKVAADIAARLRTP